MTSLSLALPMWINDFDSKLQCWIGTNWVGCNKAKVITYTNLFDYIKIIFSVAGWIPQSVNEGAENDLGFVDTEWPVVDYP